MCARDLKEREEVSSGECEYNNSFPCVLKVTLPPEHGALRRVSSCGLGCELHTRKKNHEGSELAPMRTVYSLVVQGVGGGGF